MVRYRQSMIDVLYVIGSLPRAGSARHLLQLVRCSRSRPLSSPHCFAFKRKESLISDFEALGVHVHGLGMRNAATFSVACRAFSSGCDASTPEACHSPHLSFSVKLFRRRSPAGSLGVPVIVTSRRSMNEIEPREAHLAPYRWTYWVCRSHRRGV